MSSTATSNSSTQPAPLVRFSYLLSTICGICSATMIVLAVLITCQMIFVRSVLNEIRAKKDEILEKLELANDVEVQGVTDRDIAFG